MFVFLQGHLWPIVFMNWIFLWWEKNQKPHEPFSISIDDSCIFHHYFIPEIGIPAQLWWSLRNDSEQEQQGSTTLQSSFTVFGCLYCRVYKNVHLEEATQWSCTDKSCHHKVVPPLRNMWRKINKACKVQLKSSKDKLKSRSIPPRSFLKKAIQIIELFSRDVEPILAQVWVYMIKI